MTFHKIKEHYTNKKTVGRIARIGMSLMQASNLANAVAGLIDWQPKLKLLYFSK